MAGFYKRNQGQLIRTLSGVGMALVLAGLVMFVYGMLADLLPRGGETRTMSVTAISADNYRLVEGWPPQEIRTVANLEVSIPADTLITETVKDEMEAFYAANQRRFPDTIAVRAEADAGYRAWLRYGVPALIFVVGAIGIVLLMNKPKFADFLIATEGEMKKVSWSSRAELIGSTTVVIATVIILAVFIYLADMSFVFLFRTINVHPEVL